jgi:glutamine amidotransferase
MCELFGISSRQPTTVQISLAEFARRGGHTGPHIDGWGVGFLREGDFLLIREPEPSHASAHLRFIHDQQIRSPLVVSHIRKATQGGVCLRNTQPFLRELGGKPQLFAHNGDLGPIRLRSEFPLGQFRPIGESDSEFAFCILLGMMQPLWQTESPPSVQHRFNMFCAFAQRMAVLGAANFLYSDGDCLFVHAHRRRHDDGEIRAPGLYLLCRSHHEHDALAGIDVQEDGQPVQMMTLLASTPLSDESWQPIPEHTALVIRHGVVIERQQLSQLQPA